MAKIGYLQEKPTAMVEDYFNEFLSRTWMILEHSNKEDVNTLADLTDAELCGAIRQWRATPLREIHNLNQTLTIETRIPIFNEHYEPMRPMEATPERDYREALERNPQRIKVLDAIAQVMNRTDDLLEFKKACNAFARVVYGQSKNVSECIFSIYDKKAEAVRPHVSISKTTAEQTVLLQPQG